MMLRLDSDSQGMKGDYQMVESKISSKGRTTLPKPVREALGVKPGDKVRYLILGDEVRIIPMRPLARLSGALEYEGPPKTLEEMECAVAAGACEE